eukprot:TRINITY_DN11998_c0_g1_i1.p1 TRINITY_DN11998_c0_g1~~TRINITY_DN11998_c0_g1_i1.p1  ORF type:complete len:561 (-),score=36.96 TRINITY_DN11998_c0_g1_i1:283-1965(-)
MGGFTDILPLAGNSNNFCDPEVQTRLQDVNLIVVGRGPLAEELIRKRRASGGRVCWLFTTERPCGAEKIQDLDEQEKLGGSTVSPKQKSTPAKEDFDGDSELLFSVGRFIWNPCSLAVNVPSAKDAATEKTLRKLRRTFGCSELSWRTTGPTIIPLGDDQCYSVLTVSDGHACGIRVLRMESQEIVWELSGTVIFAGVAMHSSLSCLPVRAVATSADVKSLCVDCLNEEAKPYATVDPKHVGIWALIMFAQFLIFFLVMSNYESEISSGYVPWWRATYSLFHGAIGGLTATPFLFGPCLTGRIVSSRAAVVCLVVCAITHFAAPLVPLTNTGTRVSIYLAECLGFGVYFPISLVLQFRYPKPLSDPPRLNAARICRHIAWFFTVAWGCFGNWMVFYAVGLLYVYVSMEYESIASIALPALVGCIELVSVAGLSGIYNRLVYKPRVLVRSAKGSMVGDQKLRFIVPICLTHAYAECARILCVFAVTVKNPQNPWALSLASSLLWNVGARLYGSTFLASVLLPRRYCWLFAPDAGTVLHNEARLCFGYLRHVVLLVVLPATL